MTRSEKFGRLSKKQLEGAIQEESKHFEEYYRWLEKHMPSSFFEEIHQEQLMLISHYLMGFPMQDYFCHIYLKDSAFVICLDSPDVDLRILKHYSLYGIKNYQTFLSDTPPPFPGVTKKLRIATIYFTVYEEENQSGEISWEDRPSREHEGLRGSFFAGSPGSNAPCQRITPIEIRL